MPTRLRISTTRRSRNAARAPCNCAWTTREDAGGAGILDPAAIAEVTAESWPVVRDADELHDALATLVVLPPVPAWTSWFDELARAAARGDVVRGRDAVLGLRGASRRAPPASFIPARTSNPRSPRWPACRCPKPTWRSQRSCAVGWSRAGPVTVAELSHGLALDEEALAGANVFGWRPKEQVLRGRFRGSTVSKSGATAPRPRPDSSPDHRATASRDRTGHRRRLRALFCTGGSTLRRSSAPARH